MPGLETTGANPDVDLLYDINGLAVDAPHWFDRVMEWVGEYGIMAGLGLLLVVCWWRARSGRDPVPAVAALVWAPLAALTAVVVNIPIRGFVERPRPFLDHRGLEVLVSGKDDYSFVSDHSTMAMAIGVALFVANRRFGLMGIALALLEGFCRIYMGVHYPTDVIGGFALGTAVALLLAPPAMALLTRLLHVIGRTWAAPLVRAGRPGAVAGEGAGHGEVSASRRQKDLAA